MNLVTIPAVLYVISITIYEYEFRRYLVVCMSLTNEMMH